MEIEAGDFGGFLNKAKMVSLVIKFIWLYQLEDKIKDTIKHCKESWKVSVSTTVTDKWETANSMEENDCKIRRFEDIFSAGVEKCWVSWGRQMRDQASIMLITQGTMNT